MSDEQLTLDSDFGDMEDDVFAQAPEKEEKTETTENKEDVTQKPKIKKPDSIKNVVKSEEKTEKPEPEKKEDEKTEKDEKSSIKKAFKKAKASILRRGRADDFPELSYLMRGKEDGEWMKISDIGIFIEEPSDEILAELAKSLKVRNRVNLSAHVLFNRVKQIGAQIVKAGRMYQPIQVAKIKEDGSFECTSGRHRLIFLALIYGPDTKVPVYKEDMTLNEARDAVLYANTSRKINAMEKAEHTVLSAVGGDVDAEQDELYAKSVTTKSAVKEYCAYSVIEKNRPAKLEFPIGLASEGGLATINTIKGFWGKLDWHKEMERKEFDQNLKESVDFLNKLVECFRNNSNFIAKQHMASMTLGAVGKYYQTTCNAGVDIDDALIKKLSGVVIALGIVGRQTIDKTYAAIVAGMKK